jgi:hypothetical protein
MHAGERQNRSGSSLTQSQADACCASSEQEPADQSSPAPAAGPFALVSTSVVPPIPMALDPRGDRWPAHPPPVSVAVSKHVLFSVYLV